MTCLDFWDNKFCGKIIYVSIIDSGERIPPRSLLKLSFTVTLNCQQNI